MKRNSRAWKIYKWFFLDFWQRSYYHTRHKPQVCEFNTEAEIKDYLSELNLQLQLKHLGKDYDWTAKNNPLVKTTNATPRLFYASHPGSLDALFVYFVLRKINPAFVSYVHNFLTLAFLRSRSIPVATNFRAQRLDVLALKLKLARQFEDIDDIQAKKMNQAVPEQVVDLLAINKPVVIFPSGGFGQWQDGVGFIVELYARMYPGRELLLQPLKISDFGEIKSVLHGWRHVLGSRKKSVVRVEVGSTISLSQLKKTGLFASKKPSVKQKAKQIRQFLETNYRQQF